MSDPSFGLPSFQNVVIGEDQKFTPEWQRGLTRLAQLSAERKIRTVSPGASPFTYTATTIGHLLISGGTIGSVSLARGSQNVACPLGGFIPMAAKDSVVMTYTVAPTLTFIPSARA